MLVTYLHVIILFGCCWVPWLRAQTLPTCSSSLGITCAIYQSGPNNLTMTWTPNCEGGVYYETYPYENPYGSGSSPFLIIDQATGSSSDWWLVGPNWDWICETGYITIQPWPLPTPTMTPTTATPTTPSSQPTSSPTTVPSTQPILAPTTSPSMIPTQNPLSRPSISPSALPSPHITTQPTSRPSVVNHSNGISDDDDNKKTLLDSMWFVLVIGIIGGAILMTIIGIVYYRLVLINQPKGKSEELEFSSPIHDA